MRTRLAFAGLIGASGLIIAAVGCGSLSDEQERLGALEQKIWAPRWENLGGDAQNDPAVASWASGRLDVFWRGTNNHLMHRWYPNFGAWSFLQDLGGTPASSVAAVATDNLRLDVFYFDSSRNLIRQYFDGSAWGTQTITLAATEKPPVGSGPTVTSWSAGRLDVFWRGTDNKLKHIWRTSYTANWTAVQDLGESLSSDPGAVSDAAVKIDVFWRDANNALRHKWFPSCVGCNTWSTSTTRTPSNTVFSAPDVASWGTNRLDVFWTSLTGGLEHTWRFDNNTWWGPNAVQHLGGAHVGGPAAVSWGADRIDIFMRQGTSNDIERLTWQISNQTDPLYTQPPLQPTVVATNNNVVGSDEELWEFSSTAAPPSASCPGGAFVTSGSRTHGHAPVLSRISPVTSTAVGTDVVGQLFVIPNASVENDSVMTRAKNGDLLLVRGAILDANCQPTGCTFPAGCLTKGRSGTAVFRSSDCGSTWTLDQAKDIIDPTSKYTISCWGGWDREEVHYDYFSDRLFISVGAQIPDGSGNRETFVFRSQPGGAGPYTNRKIMDGTPIPFVMTSMPKQLFIFNCDNGTPTLRWIQPASFATGTLHKHVFTGQTCAESLDFTPAWTSGTSITRVANFIDDSSVEWWVLRVGFPIRGSGSIGDKVRILTVRVKDVDGSAVVMDTHDITAGTAPSGQSRSSAVELTALETYPRFDAAGTWDGENTAVYYWREQFWNDDINELLCNRVSMQNKTRAVAVRDIGRWGQPFDVGTVAPYNSCSKLPAFGDGFNQRGLPGDYVQGSAYYDANQPGSPLRFLMLVPDIPASTGGFGQQTQPRLRSTLLALPAGIGNN